MSLGVSAAPALSADDPKLRSVRVQQIFTVALLTVAMAAYFWVDSRYPSLLKKLHAGHAIKAAGAISFDALLPVDPKMPVTARIERTTVNWLWTNRVGMSFGIGFGAAMLTLLPMVRRRRMKTGFGNTILGIAAGTPLGVCANCVAPIGRGLAQSGASANTVLATMISSPTLNVVVLAMAFSLFPVRLVILKLATVVALLALTPWLAPKTEPVFVCDVPATVNSGAVLVLFLSNLAKLIAVTVPLMVLAGLLGAVSAELLPASTLPAQVSFLAIVAVALIGTFLPVPMAFDVAIAFVLMSRGVPMPYVVTLLCTLGVFSIYSAMILGTTFSWRTAAKMYGAVAGLGVSAGVVAAMWG